MFGGKVTKIVSGVRMDLTQLARNVPENVIARSLNRTVTGVKTEAAQEIGKIYNLPARVIKAVMKVTRATRLRLVAEIEARGRPIPLYEFGASERKRTGDVTVKVLRSGGRKVVRGKSRYLGRPFVQTMKSGHVGIFQRVGAARKPIKELYSISLPGVFTTEKVAVSIRRVAYARFEREIVSNMRYYLSKR